MISPQGRVYNLFSVCGTVSFRGTEGSRKGGFDEERECLFSQCPENCSSPLEHPFLRSALLYFLACSSHVGATRSKR